MDRVMEHAAEPGRVGDPLVGRILDGRYRILERIARGGMASVYTATDLRLDRLVAVKVMHTGLGDDAEFAARFVREARAAARLAHPHVVAVFDQGDDAGTVYLAMEHVAGHTLRDVVSAQAPLPATGALALVEPVVAALAEAHRAGIVHRDVKPENVLIADDGRVKVADFGLAKAVSSDTQHTLTGGVLIGTVSYLAPELVVDGRADARVDVYAVGVLLHELLTGRKPHEGETPLQVAWKHVHEDVPPPSALVPGLPAYVDALVARATSRDRSHRPADAGVLLHQLRRVAQALHSGVDDDPELVADLLPPAPVADDDRADGGGGTDGADGADRADRADRAEATTAVPALPASPAGDPGPRRPGAPAGVTVRRPGRAGAGRLRSRRGLALLLVGVLAAVGLGAGAWWWGVARWTQTPAVTGLAQLAATERLEEAGLEVELGPETWSESVPAGRVVSTDPAPGERVLDGSTVTVVISLGKERYDVPQLRGRTVDAAQDALRTTNLAYGGTRETWHEKVPEGRVVRTTPPAGTILRPDTPVELLVSKGPRPVKVGAWAGRPFSDAVAALEERGLKAEKAGEEYSDEVAEGRVISHDPPGGTLPPGGTVSFVVSLGPELIEVPELRASGVKAARERLEALGFEVRTEKAPGHLGLGYVFSTDPGGGSMAPKGSTITLSVI